MCFEAASTTGFIVVAEDDDDDEPCVSYAKLEISVALGWRGGEMVVHVRTCV
jgi:hypothetical protein